jgi:hypothetical protein
MIGNCLAAWSKSSRRGIDDVRATFVLGVFSDTGTQDGARCSTHMPRFFFDIADGPKSETDDEGLEFPDLKAARESALETLGEIARDELPDGDRRDFKISIRDESGQILLKALLALRVEETT